jgi:hypothetical protein
MRDRSGERRATVRGAGGRSPALLVAVAALVALVNATGSLAYYEDLDTPASHSTFHYELTRLLARAAGFSAADAETLAVAAQTVDLLSFAGELPGSPAMTMSGTSRYSEDTAKYFHFARRGPTTSTGTGYPGGRDTCANFTATDEPCTAAGGEAGELELWAMTGAATLSLPVPTVSVDGAPAAPVEGGSLVALGIYLHSLADSYSHEKCGQDAHTRRHCLPAKPDCPASCTTEFWHGQAEYGAGGAGVPFTGEAGRAVWQELKRYRQLHALPGGPLWDDATAEAFIDEWTATARGSARSAGAIEAYDAIATCTLECSAVFAPAPGASLAVTFTGQATPTTCAGAVSFDWEFGDGSPHASGPSAEHAYAAPGTFSWSLLVSADGATCSAAGTVTVPTARVRRRLAREHD